MHLMNFNRAYLGDLGKIHSNYRLLSIKSQYFPNWRPTLLKRIFYFSIPYRCRSFYANFYPWTLCNSKVTDFWPLPLKHYLKLVLTYRISSFKRRPPINDAFGKRKSEINAASSNSALIRKFNWKKWR